MVTRLIFFNPGALVCPSPKMLYKLAFLASLRRERELHKIRILGVDQHQVTVAWVALSLLGTPVQPAPFRATGGVGFKQQKTPLFCAFYPSPPFSSSPSLPSCSFSLLPVPGTKLRALCLARLVLYHGNPQALWIF